MSTILTSPDGRRRCDGVCHAARGTKCACICGGKFHGALLSQPEEISRITHALFPQDVTADSEQPRLFDQRSATNAN